VISKNATAIALDSVTDVTLKGLTVSEKTVLFHLAY
jgi:hypothetical protein